MKRPRKSRPQKDFTGIATAKISKLQAARRQIDSAIYLEFTSSEFVSVHTLVYAANEILDALLRAQGITSLSELRDSLILPERLDEAKQLLSDAANFFKHGLRDPNETIEFAPA